MKRRPILFIAPIMLCLCFWGCAGSRAQATAGPLLLAANPAEEASDATAPAAAKAQDQAHSPDADQELTNDNLDFLDEEDTQKAQAVSVRDPFAPFNRAIYHVNDKFYYWILKPVTRGYRAVTPQFFRKGIRNFFINLGFPTRFLSCLLQGKGHEAEAQFGRFFYNSTVGFLGFTDIAEKKPEMFGGTEDMGQTLGKWGVDPGPYLVIPVLGPFTLRDLVGFGGDRFTNIESYIKPFSLSMGIAAYQVVNDTTFTLGDYETLKAMALDPYEAMRDAYVQSREKKISE
ncbi:MAG: VacJ family lipoprotein [Thermodesulfobacteriota bacterium]